MKNSENAQWKQLNQRRIFLLDKKRVSGLDAQEIAELSHLRDQLSEMKRRVADIKAKRRMALMIKIKKR